MIVGALSFAPLELENHEEYDVQYSWDEGNSTYTAIAREGVNPIAALPDDDEQQWELTYEEVLPVQKNADYKLGYAVEWAFDDEGKSIPVVVNLNATSLASLEATMDESRFSYSIEGGELGNNTGLALTTQPALAMASWTSFLRPHETSSGLHWA